ncbi:MAG: hypothetical protein HYT12_04475 [Candidatus Liptonbacteria bacterium]|nr:hypothetical protein [Candidatus Liptonbacteria bacterium]
MPLEDTEKNLYKKEISEREKEKAIDSVAKKSDRKPQNIPGWDLDATNEKELGIFELAKKYKKAIKFSLAGIAFGIVVVFGYLLFQIFTYSGISLALTHPEEVMIGVPFDVVVSYSNNSPSILSGAKLSLSLPPEMTFVNESDSRRVKTEDIGVLGVGTIGQKIFKIIAVSGEATSKDISAIFEYSTAGIDSRFEKIVIEEVLIGKSAVSLDLIHANQVLSGETFDIKLVYRNESAETLKNLELRLDYPANFTFKNSSLKPDVGNSVWRLGDLRPGSGNEIIVQGSVIAQADSFFEIKVALVSNPGENEFGVGEKVSSISISSPPLSLSISLNNKSDYIAKPDDNLSYTINFVNTGDVGFRDVIIKAKLTGEMFDLSSVDPSINFNALNNTLTWNKSIASELGLIAPGVSGSISFRLRTKENYPIERLNDRDFILKVEVEIESPTVPQFIAADKTVSIAKIETKVAGFVKVEALGFFRDAASGILNQGAVPPKVNEPTNYTVHWVISNFATDIADVELRAFLKPGVRATGVIKSNVDAEPVYNERTQEMIWRIPGIQATRGVISEPLEAIFQIEALPTVNMIGQSMPLVGGVELKATDLFTNATLNYSVPQMDTSLGGSDPTIQSSDTKVAQ